MPPSKTARLPDLFGGLMQKVAARISYRAVRNHGTIGGSVALADPAADWPCCLMALERRRPHRRRATACGRSRSPISSRANIRRRWRPTKSSRLRHSASRRDVCAGASSRSRARAARSPIRSPSSSQRGSDGPVSVVLGAAAPRPSCCRRSPAQISAGESVGRRPARRDREGSRRPVA